MQMKTKLLRKAREKYQIEHVHNPKLYYRLVDRTNHEILPITDWYESQEIVKAWQRRFILIYCRSNYSKKTLFKQKQQIKSNII